MAYQIKGIIVKRPLVMWWWDARGGEAFHSPIIRPHSFSKRVPVDCEPHMCVSVFFSLFRGAGYLRLDLGIALFLSRYQNWLELGISLHWISYIIIP